jgi:hypothetical protein
VEVGHGPDLARGAQLLEALELASFGEDVDGGHWPERNVDTAAIAVTILNVPSESDLYEVEVLEGEVVEASHLQLDRRDTERLPTRATQPAVQTAIAVATGFVAGAATMALLRRYGLARLERAAAAPALEQQRPEQARTFVVHVRQL